MTDDLLKRLDAAQDDPDLIYGDEASHNLLSEAANRIRELEARLRTSPGGDGAIGCALYLTEGNVRALKGNEK
jgi:hypothetical protein